MSRFCRLHMATESRHAAFDKRLIISMLLIIAMFTTPLFYAFAFSARRAPRFVAACQPRHAAAARRHLRFRHLP